MRRAHLLTILFAAFVAAPAVLAQDTVRVIVAQATVRAEPNAKAPVLTQAKSGTRLEVRGIQGDWYQVAVFVSGVRVQGYVARAQVTPERRDASGTPIPMPSPAPAATQTANKPAVTPAPASVPAPPRSSASAPVTVAGLSAAVEADGKTLTLSTARSRVIKLAERVDSVRDAALAMPVGGGRPLPSSPSATITYVWVVDDPAGARTISQRKPAISVQYRDVPGLSPDDFSPVLVRIVGSAAGPRLAALARGRVDQAARTQADWDLARDIRYDLVMTTAEPKGRGVVRLAPSAALEPGQYAVMLRPTGNKRFAGSSVLSEKEEGRLFGLIFPFVVK